MKVIGITRSLSLSLAVGLALVAGPGCNSVDKASKTATADKLAEGHSDLQVTLDHGGQLQVWDADTNKIVYQADVNKRDKVAVDPKGDRIVINGDTVAQPGLTPDHRYQVYLKR